MRHTNVSHRRLDDRAAKLKRLASSEEEAKKFLIANCFGERKPFCPRCRENKLYVLNGSRYRCSSCKYTFQDFSGRWINNGGLSCTEWIRLIQLFAEDNTAHAISLDLGISYNAAYKAVSSLRFAILAQAIDAVQLLGPETGLHKHLNNKKLTGIPAKTGSEVIPVFGVLEKNGWVFIDLMQNINAESVFHFNHNFHLKLVRHGSIIHTDRYQKYNALILCGDDSLPLDYIRKYPGVTPEIEKSDGEFWTFARDRFKRYKGISPHRFPLYLKELEFRFNNRDKDIFNILVNYVCKIVPDVD
ncbi:IS1595 family transposase [Maridesulfovibrio ferrireducens]|uniref:IS1595 family transposase n=1 Tax=Maridesulfovibrio ferrireducens TaxID=246191 RepID=UPI001A29825B|nr:IS1595 family transposase [Maridesulfovibrio ferrireducens]MBI9112308.1 IS1595 family transposase [Maridesulfovibrio ferrireducens]